MFLHKFQWDEKNPVFTYTTDSGKKIVLRPGMASPLDGRAVTAEDIHNLINMYNSEVRNNLKNAHAPLTPEQKEEVREWEEKHPGERCPLGWNTSLDNFSDDDDSDADRSEYMGKLCSSSENPEVERLLEVIEELSDLQRESLILVERDGFTLQQVAKMKGCSVNNISKAVIRAKNYIRENF